MKKSSTSFRWENSTIKHSIILQSMGPGAYNFIRESGLFYLPSERTLHNYTGPSTAEVGVTDIIRKRIKLAVDLLPPMQRIVSLKIDGMHIQRSKSYVKILDKNIGVVDMGGVPMEGVEEESDTLATDLLAFVIEGNYFHESLLCKKI